MLSSNIQSRRNSIWSEDAQQRRNYMSLRSHWQEWSKWGKRKSSDWLLITFMTGRDNMPVTGFSLKPTEAQPLFCPGNRVKLGWSEVLLAAKVVSIAFLTNNGSYQTLKVSQQETVHPLGKNFMCWQKDCFQMNTKYWKIKHFCPGKSYIYY